ncbi:MAG: hypothetical protein ACRCT8_12785 [Lacipirellulaceae bacterium]
MSQRYLVSCPCGKAVAVAPSQAGGGVDCDCGARLDVPTLRQLRELPPADVAAPARGAWGARQGIVACGVMLAALALGLAGYCLSTAPTPPAPFDAGAHGKLVSGQIDALTPAEAYAIWQNVYAPLRVVGYQAQQRPEEAAIAAEIALRQQYATSLAVLAGVALVAAAIGAALVGPASTPRG